MPTMIYQRERNLSAIQQLLILLGTANIWYACYARRQS